MYSELVTWCNDNTQKRTVNMNKKLQIWTTWIRMTKFSWVTSKGNTDCMDLSWTFQYSDIYGLHSQKSGDATIPHNTEDAEQYAAIYCSYLLVYWYMDASLHSIQNPSRWMTHSNCVYLVLLLQGHCCAWWQDGISNTCTLYVLDQRCVHWSSIMTIDSLTKACLNVTKVTEECFWGLEIWVSVNFASGESLLQLIQDRIQTPRSKVLYSWTNSFIQ